MKTAPQCASRCQYAHDLDVPSSCVNRCVYHEEGPGPDEPPGPNIVPINSPEPLNLPHPIQRVALPRFRGPITREDLEDAMIHNCPACRAPLAQQWTRCGSCGHQRHQPQRCRETAFLDWAKVYRPDWSGEEDATSRMLRTAFLAGWAGGKADQP